MSREGDSVGRTTVCRVTVTRVEIRYGRVGAPVGWGREER